MRCRALAMTAAIIVCLAGVSSAQSYAGGSGSDVGTFELTGGVLWTGGYAAGSANANLSRNPTTGTAPLTEFQTEGQMLRAAGADVHLGVYVGRRISVEATFQYSRPIFRARLTGDFESADPVDADETISSYLVGGSLLYHFGDGRFVPFVSGGAGYLRQLHAGNTEVLTGTEVHGGGGVKYWFGTGTHRLGLRVEAQASARAKAIAFEQKRRIVPTVAAGVSYMF
jgi:hypothetical protein